MYTVYLTADTVDADENYFDTMHDALAFVDEYIRQPDIWSLELWRGEEHIYTFSATYPHQRGEYCECPECRGSNPPAAPKPTASVIVVHSDDDATETGKRLEDEGYIRQDGDALSFEMIGVGHVYARPGIDGIFTDFVIVDHIIA